MDSVSKPAEPAPNAEEKAAMASGDIPMKIENSIQATLASESEDLSKMNNVANAENLNLDNTVNSASKNGISIVSEHGKSNDQIRQLGENSYHLQCESR